MNGTRGLFDRITAANHYQYETIPSPLNAFLCIHADYNYTSEDGPQLWDLPALIRPLRVVGSPTKNVTNANFNVENVGDLSVDRNLMKMISNRIKTSSVTDAGQMGTRPYGSMSQMCFTARSESDIANDRFILVTG